MVVKVQSELLIQILFQIIRKLLLATVRLEFGEITFSRPDQNSQRSKFLNLPISLAFRATNHAIPICCASVSKRERESEEMSKENF